MCQRGILSNIARSETFKPYCMQMRCIIGFTQKLLIASIRVLVFIPNLHLLFDTEETGSSGLLCSLRNILFPHNHLFHARSLCVFHPGGPVCIDANTHTHTPIRYTLTPTARQVTRLKYIRVLHIGHIGKRSTYLYGNLRSSSEASLLSEEAVRTILDLWNLLGLSGVLLFTMNELAGVDVYTKK